MFASILPGQASLVKHVVLVILITLKCTLFLNHERKSSLSNEVREYYDSNDEFPTFVFPLEQSISCALYMFVYSYREMLKD